MQRYLENIQRGTDSFPFAHYREKYSNKTIPLHWHPEIELLYGISGGVAVTVSNEKYTLNPGEIMLINPEELHFFEAGSREVQYHAAVFGVSLFQFAPIHFFQSSFITPLANGFLRFPRRIRRGDAAYTEVEPIVRRLFEEHITSKLMIFSDLTALLCTLSACGLMRPVAKKDEDKNTEGIKRCVRFMEENYMHKVSLETLAKLVHMTPNYYCSYFKKQTGYTSFELLNNIRIQKASELLCSSDMPIEAIAEACGFDSASYFIRKFKELQGCTPSAYRKNIRLRA